MEGPEEGRQLGLGEEFGGDGPTIEISTPQGQAPAIEAPWTRRFSPEAYEPGSFLVLPNTIVRPETSLPYGTVQAGGEFGAYCLKQRNRQAHVYEVDENGGRIYRERTIYLPPQTTFTVSNKQPRKK